MKPMEPIMPIDQVELNKPMDSALIVNRILGIVLGIFALTGQTRVRSVSFGPGEVVFSWEGRFFQFSDVPISPRPEPIRPVLTILDIFLGILLILGELHPVSLFHIRGKQTISTTGPIFQIPRLSGIKKEDSSIKTIIRILNIILGVFLLIPGHLFLTGFAPLVLGRTALAVTGPPFQLSTSPGTVPGKEPARTVGLALRIVVAWLLLINVFTVSGFTVSPEALSFSIRSPAMQISP